MSEFHRSPSKVWWAEDLSLSLRTQSSSPGSQDSGFSDTETSPSNINRALAKVKTPEKRLSDALAKSGRTPKGNLTSEIVEKCTPEKSIRLDGLISPGNVYYLPRTPTRSADKQRQSKTEPITRRQQETFSSRVNKVSRNLFSAQFENINDNHQYAAHDVTTRSEEFVNDLDFDDNLDESSDLEISCNRTVPFVSRKSDNYRQNLSAPPCLYETDEDEAVTSFNEPEVKELIDSESEMESFFKLKSPKHTSTPKIQQKHPVQRLGRVHAMNLLHKYQQKQEVPILKLREEQNALNLWTNLQKHNYEPECMTTLQCKSIAGELNEKVGQLAITTSLPLRNLLKLHEEIAELFEYYKNNKDARSQSTTRLLPLIDEYCDLTSKSKTDSGITAKNKLFETSINQTRNTLNLGKLHKSYLELHRNTLNKQIEQFLEVLSDPKDEMHVRALLTALMNLTLRNTSLITPFIDFGAIQIITAIIEKCDGSSVRGLGLRALTTLCINAKSIRHLENVSGLCTITEIICDNSRPLPERSEAIALLAQITAPWIEDNHNIQNLSQYTKRLIKYLTRFLEENTCCQNILLASAALAYVTAMDNTGKAVKYLIQQQSVETLLNIVKKYSNVSVMVYILEQIATLVATMATSQEARRCLCDCGAATALICFLQTNASFYDENVVVRLQQKVVIALSRLCTEQEAAQQVVDAYGVDKLVQLCKEKRERFDNDAILVAALATLRKITEVCGSHVVNEEDAQELIEPKLLDSFKAYKAQNESRV